jgi:hypothetical protein
MGPIAASLLYAKFGFQNSFTLVGLAVSAFLIPIFYSTFVYNPLKDI